MGKKCSFKEHIIPQMKEMATDAAKSVFTKIAPHNQMNNFQIFGLDFMIDRNMKPWLIEINTNPCLDCSSPLLNRIIPYLVEQSFKLSIDLAFPPPTHYPNTCKHFAPLVSLQTFKYQLIFDSGEEGGQLLRLYKRVRSNFSKFWDMQWSRQVRQKRTRNLRTRGRSVGLRITLEFSYFYYINYGFMRSDCF